jgi:hypothetical protein
MSMLRHSAVKSDLAVVVVKAEVDAKPRALARESAESRGDLLRLVAGRRRLDPAQYEPVGAERRAFRRESRKPQRWTQIKEEEADFDLGLALVVDAELYRLDAVVRWLDAVEDRLKRAAIEPPGPVPASLPRRRRRVGVRR